MNWFILASVILYLGGGIYEVYRGNAYLATVYFSWSISNTALAVMK